MEEVDIRCPDCDKSSTGWVVREDKVWGQPGIFCPYCDSGAPLKDVLDCGLKFCREQWAESEPEDED